MNISKIDTNEERSLIEGILFYLHVLAKYKILIFVGTTISAIVIVLFSIISLKLPPDKSPLPNVYRAYAVVMFQNAGGDGGMSSMLSAFGVESALGNTYPSQIALQILKSRTFIDKIVNQFDIIDKLDIENDIKTESRNYILNNTDYSFNKDSGALTISFYNIDPLFASELVNYEVTLLEDWFLNEGSSIRSKQLSLMEDKLNDLTKEISIIEQEIKYIQNEYGVMNITEVALSQSKMLIDLKSKLKEAELEINTHTEYSTIEDPALISLKNRRNNIITQIKEIESGYNSSDGGKMPSHDELTQLSLDFTHLQADLEIKNQLYKTLSERYEVTKLVAAEEGVFKVLEYAEIPEVKDYPSRGRLCIIVTFLTFLFLIFLSLTINMIKNISKNSN